MSYIEKIFNKKIEELDLSDLQKFFETPQEETSILEFKSGDVEVNDLYKEITAFLNTEGGLIIVGSPREKKERKGKYEKIICEGELTYTSFKNKDWLYQKITSNIMPIPTNLKIFEHIDINGSIYVIDVPQSFNPPHQCLSEGKYYIRLEREAKPAPHGIVQALFQKRRIPKLKADINFTPYKNQIDEVEVRIQNDSNIPADKVSFGIDVFNVLNVENDHEFYKTKDNYLGEKFTLSGSFSQVLVRVISIPIDFYVTHKNDEYIILVSYWSKDTDFDFQFWTFNPSENRIICADQLEYENTSFIDEIERIKKQ